MRSLRMLMILVACPAWLGVVPAMAQSTGQPTGKAATGATSAPDQMMQSPGKRPPKSVLGTATIATELTKGECIGLGGTVDFNKSCAKKGQEGCYTVDSDGVIRVACINKK